MESTTSTSLGGLRPQPGKEVSLVDLTGGKPSDTIIIVGEGQQKLGSSVSVMGEIEFLKMAANLHLAASAAPLMLANYDFVLDCPGPYPLFEKVAAAVMRSIAQDMGIEALSAKYDPSMFRLSMRLRCIPWQVQLLENRFPEATVTLVMEMPATPEEAETTGEDGKATA